MSEGICGTIVYFADNDANHSHVCVLPESHVDDAPIRNGAGEDITVISHSCGFCNEMWPVG